MTEHKLKGMGCEFDDLISDTAKVSETTGNGMSERHGSRRQLAIEALDSLVDYLVARERIAFLLGLMLQRYACLSKETEND